MKLRSVVMGCYNTSSRKNEMALNLTTSYILIKFAIRNSFSTK
jgi:hypothetical protein